MADFALTSNQASIPVPQTFLYQEIASPPPFTEEIAPPFFGAVYPDKLTRLPGVPGWFTQNIEPLPDAPAAATFFGAVYPDRLARLPGAPGWFTQNVEPLPDAPAAPDFFDAIYPDRFEVRRLPLGWFTQNIEPLPAAPAAPDFFGAVYPDKLLDLPRVHSYFHAPPSFETLPAPDFGQRAVFPDGFPGLPRYHSYFHAPPPFEKLPAPDQGARAVFPDRLDRQAYLWPTPQAVMNLEPVANLVPDFGNRAIFPDRLVGHPPIPGMFAQNVEPIPNPPAPDFTSVIYPNVLRGFAPLPPPSRFYTPTPTTFLVLEDYSRGLHVGDVRGFYHTPYISTCEPFAGCNTVDVQVIPHATYTVLDLNVASPHAGFASTAVNMDRWKMLDLVGDRIIFRHEGYYIMTVRGGWQSTGTGERRVRIRYYSASGVAQRVVMEDMRAATGVGAGAIVAASSDIEPVGRGAWIQVEVYQSSGGDLNTSAFFISVFRIARPNPVLPA